MHGKVAAGKISAIAFNDDEKRIEIAAKIVDDEEWRKIEEGVYTGFSQGGLYAKRWADPETPDFTRYTACPSEISLVDLPCLPQATFELVKADGVHEKRAFAGKAAPSPVVGVGPCLRAWLNRVGGAEGCFRLYAIILKKASRRKMRRREKWFPISR